MIKQTQLAQSEAQISENGEALTPNFDTRGSCYFVERGKDGNYKYNEFFLNGCYLPASGCVITAKHGFKQNVNIPADANPVLKTLYREGRYCEDLLLIIPDLKEIQADGSQRNFELQLTDDMLDLHPKLDIARIHLPKEIHERLHSTLKKPTTYQPKTTCVTIGEAIWVVTTGPRGTRCIKGLVSDIEESTEELPSQKVFIHTADTTGGHSGAIVKNSFGHIVGIHRGVNITNVNNQSLYISAGLWIQLQNPIPLYKQKN